MTQTVPPTPPSPAIEPEEPAVTGFARLMDRRIGIVPLPLLLAIAVILAMFVAKGKVPADLTTNILILTAGGFASAEIGKWIPGLNKIGAPAIVATFLPSYLVWAKIIPAPLKQSIVDFTEQSNFLYLFIGSIIVGSILAMDRRMLIRGFAKIFVPLFSGSILAGVVGMGVATLLGIEWHYALFRIVVPIMGGGVGEGAIPLSIGYAALGGGDQGVILAEILPAVMFGSLCAVLISGCLNLVGKRRPEWTGEGTLQPGEHDEELAGPDRNRRPSDLQTIGSAVILAMTLYTIGALVQAYTKFPGPVTMLFLAVIIKLGRLISPALEDASYRNYRFFATLVTYPLLFAIGVAKTPWEKLMASFNGPELITIFVTVSTLIGTGFFVGRLAGLYPIEAAIVNACHSGQGGTGDVAILSAANRMQLMPFAQVATRIGGAITVTLALAAFARFH